MKNMRSSPLQTLLISLITIPHQISAYHALGTRTVTVQSNETLRMITEFNHTDDYTQLHLSAQEANTTIEELVASQLAMEFDVCFPDYYCPAASVDVAAFISTFDEHVCGQYCNEIRYHSVIQVLGVCEQGHSGYANSGCIDFGLTIQASSRSEAEAIKKDLGAMIVGSKSIWRNLLRELAPQFTDHDINDPGVLGTDISKDIGETWYPAWDKGHELCSNDGNVPFYMKLDPNEYLFPTMTDCCRKHYWWNVRGCAEPQNRPCPEGYVPTPEQIAREGIMSGKYYGSYPNIMYSGCIPQTSPHSNNRALELYSEVDQEQKLEVDPIEEARRRELHHRDQEHKLEALLERQKKLEKLMLPSSHVPPVHVDWKPQRLR